MKECLVDNKTVGETQSGFRLGHSTVTTNRSIILISLTPWTGSICAASVANLSKAFDSVDQAVVRLSDVAFSDGAIARLWSCLNQPSVLTLCIYRWTHVKNL